MQILLLSTIKSLANPEKTKGGGGELIWEAVIWDCWGVWGVEGGVAHLTESPY